MDKFEVVLLPKALKFYNKCSDDLAEKLNHCFEELENNPFTGRNRKALKSKDKLYRYRLGSYRVIYEVDKTLKKVGVLLISPRPSAYRNIN